MRNIFIGVVEHFQEKLSKIRTFNIDINDEKEKAIAKYEKLMILAPLFMPL